MSPVAFDAGSPVFNVTTQSGYSAITDGVTTAGSTTMISAGDTSSWKTSVSVGLQIFGGSIPTGATIVTVNSTSNVTISAPASNQVWELQSQPHKFCQCPCRGIRYFSRNGGAFVQAFAARYGNAPNLAYVVMGGPGRQEESYFCFTPNDMDYFINTLGGLPNWEQGVKWIIDQYGTYFPNTPFIMAMADPIPTTDGDNSLMTVVNYGVAQHPGNHFGVMSCGLQYPNGPDNGSMGATEIPLLSPTSTVGYQFYQTQHEDIDPVTGRIMLDLGLERGVNFGAHFIEVYKGDCDDPVLAPVLTAWGARMTTTPPIPPASTNVPSDFNNDRHSDYLLYNSTTGQTVIYYMNNNVQMSSTCGPTLPGGWQVAAVGDFNRDSRPDYLLFNPATRQTVIWYMNNNIYLSGISGPTPPDGWSVVAASDFNLDGYPDYLLYNANTGATVIWYMRDNVHTGSTSGPTVPGGWIPVAP
jgi:FG-GAP-like repeat